MVGRRSSVSKAKGKGKGRGRKAKARSRPVCLRVCKDEQNGRQAEEAGAAGKAPGKHEVGKSAGVLGRRERRGSAAYTKRREGTREGGKGGGGGRAGVPVAESGSGNAKQIKQVKGPAAQSRQQAGGEGPIQIPSTPTPCPLSLSVGPPATHVTTITTTYTLCHVPNKNIIHVDPYTHTTIPSIQCIIHMQ